ncbi:hypothetical protein [Pectobacterium brasiliense]|uniref:hypothetical protein n=1 Tax=Pectobacterium brasiliense TaxID=180957 RepID=UPI001F256E5D|nr:hypothetical protein [Pectobacterium brasiliense]
MKATIGIAAFLIAAVWGLYFYNFGKLSHLSTSKEVWGQFGDYVGGVINPLLSFITIILLIKSLNEQQVANKSLIEETKRQEKLENFKKLESRFYNLIDLQQKGFGDFFIEYETSISLPKRKFEGPFAANFLERNVMQLVDSGASHDYIRSAIESWDSHDHLISLVRRFYLLIKLIDDKAEFDEKEELYETLINLTDIKLLTIICIMVSYYDWDSIRHIKNSKILNRDGLSELISFFSQE